MPTGWWLNVFQICFEREYFSTGMSVMQIYTLKELPEGFKSRFDLPHYVKNIFDILRDEYSEIWKQKMDRK